MEKQRKTKSLKEHVVELDKLLCILHKNPYNTDTLFKLYFKHKVRSFIASKVTQCDVEDNIIITLLIY